MPTEKIQNQKIKKTKPFPLKPRDWDKLSRRALFQMSQMIYIANHRDNIEKGDPKIGGHPSASSSSLHITAALHLFVKTGFDFIANKPHASPMDHTWNYLLDLFFEPDGSRMNPERAEQAMHGLRKFPQDNEPVFQSYHSHYDPDYHGFLPSGTVGIPPVNIGYLALAYHYCRSQGYKVPDAHFWAILGDSEFREGSVFEAVPEFAERELGNVTWIVDYNRQSLDGHRLTHSEVMQGNDATRIERTMRANGWEVIHIRHGSLRKALFEKKHGELFRRFLEDELSDYEMQALLLLCKKGPVRSSLLKTHPHLKPFLSQIDEDSLIAGLTDFGGHDLNALVSAMQDSRRPKNRPTLILAHTLKGWGLEAAAVSGNHSIVASKEEIAQLAANSDSRVGLFERYEESTPIGQFLKKRGDQLYKDILAQKQLAADNRALFAKNLPSENFPDAIGISTKMASYPHTQWMLGQCTSKISRLANSVSKDIPSDEKSLAKGSEMVVMMAPDVGTSTNLNPSMDGHIFGLGVQKDWESLFGIKDKKAVDLVPGKEKGDRFFRFEIAESNVMSCLGSYGKIRDILGIPLLPLMTIYDFFIKRAHDQFFYDLYWRSSFILVGTPSGVTLSPEGAQHGWKSDFQIPNQITWEPFYCIELDWILADAMKRHFSGDNQGRTGVVIRNVTRGVDQKTLLPFLRRQARFKKNRPTKLQRPEFPVSGGKNESEFEPLSDTEILYKLRDDVLSGAYSLVDYRNYAGYEPGDNVIHLFAMGSVATEAIAASETLLEKGIYANVFIVTSPDLLCGNLALENNYDTLLKRLEINATLHFHPPRESHHKKAVLKTAAGQRVPILSVHDGEPGLLDNLGSIIGVRHVSQAVRRHSRSGNPGEIFRFHGLDADTLIAEAQKLLAQEAETEVSLEGIL